MTLAAEMARLNRNAAYMLGHGGGSNVASEAPMRVHSRDVDYGDEPSLGHPLEIRERTFGHGAIDRTNPEAGHDGLGAHAFHPSFIAWLRDAGVCVNCEGEHVYPCSMVESSRLRRSQNKSHPRRLKRAFRQLRSFDPAAYDITWLLVARGMPWLAATGRINDERERRGQEPYSHDDLAVFTISGMSVLSAAF